MDNLLNFYNTLLGIEITIFGIISAVILVFVQLVYTNYTYKHIGHLLKNWWLILFFVFSVIDLFITATGSFLLLVIPASMLPAFVTSPWYILVCLLLIFVSISFFVTLIVKNISYLQPHRAIFLLANSFRYEEIRDFIWHKYGLEPPYNLRVRFVIDFDSVDNSEKTEAEIKAGKDKKDQDDDRKLEAIEKTIGKIKKRTSSAEDPLLSIRDMMIQFIRRSDFSSLTEAQDLLQSVLTDFVSKVPKANNDDWSPNGSLVADFSRYVIELLSTLLEVADKEGLETSKKIILNVCFGYSQLLFEKSYYSELDLMHKYLQKVADGAIGKSSILFQDILDYYKSVGESTFDLFKVLPPEKGDDRLNILDNLFKSVGWLGERLLMRLPIEDSPMMRNYDYSTEYDALINCLLSLSGHYDRELSGAYPLICFDALFVVLKQLVSINSSSNIRRLDENIYDIVYQFASFAENAIQVGNSDGAALASIRVKEAFEEVRKAGMNDLASDVIKCLVKIGMLAAGNKESLHAVNFMSKSLDLWAADTLFESGINIEKEVLDCYIHTFEIKDHEAKWAFITKLGVRMGTNFGLAFDSKTGESYADDDPRRR